MKTPVTSADWYDTPLYYDIVFDADTGKEVTFLEAVMRRHSGIKRKAPRRILEPACGSGRLMAALAEQGHEVSGFDGNANMLDYARERLAKRGAAALLWQDRLERFSAPSRKKFDLAHCLVSTFKYIPDEAGAVSHLRHVADVLAKGGLYVLGLHLTDYDGELPDHERWEEERDGIHVICNTHTWPADRVDRLEKLRTRLRISRGGKSWTQETKWTFRTYDARQLRALLRKVPELELVGCYGFNYDIDDPRPLNDDSYAATLILRKR
jgi:SAM-dependent methyltransferase